MLDNQAALAKTVNPARPFDIDLTGINVVVLFFSPDLTPETTSEAEPDPKVWEQKFTEMGAKSVRIVNVDNSYEANPYD